MKKNIAIGLALLFAGVLTPGCAAEDAATDDDEELEVTADGLNRAGFGVCFSRGHAFRGKARIIKSPDIDDWVLQLRYEGIVGRNGNNAKIYQPFRRDTGDEPSNTWWSVGRVPKPGHHHAVVVKLIFDENNAPDPDCTVSFDY